MDKIINAILRTGGNRSCSQLRIIYNFMLKQSQEEYTDFLRKEYGEGGKGFEIGGEKYAVWFNNSGMQIALGNTVRCQPVNKIFLSWDDVSSEIRQLLLQGEYAPQSVLDAARGNAVHEHAEILNNMARDMAYGVKEMVFADASVFSGGYPEITERIEGLIEQSEFLLDLNERLSKFAKSYLANKELMRFKSYRPDQVSKSFQKFALPFHPYQAQEKFQWNSSKVFITDDEIDSFLVGSGSCSDCRLATYSFFLCHTNKTERSEFLKNRYGIGGCSHALSQADDSHATYDGKGLQLERGCYGNPDAQVKLNWNQVAERVSRLIERNEYLKPADYSRMPVYERERMTDRVLVFYDRLPNEVVRPFKQDVLNETARKIIPSMLADAEQTATLLEQMDKALLVVPIDSPEYDEKSKILRSLHEYVAGNYTLFPKKNEFSSSEQKNIQISFIF